MTRIFYKGMYKVGEGEYKAMHGSTIYKFGKWYILSDNLDMVICEHAYHMCDNLVNVSKYFSSLDGRCLVNQNEEPVLLFVECEGLLNDDDKNYNKHYLHYDDKSCTDCYRIVYEMTKKEYNEILNQLDVISATTMKMKRMYEKE